MNANTNINSQFTLTPLTTAIEFQPTKPEFLRLPKPGQHCRITGMKRGFLNLLILPCKENDFKPPVKSYVLRRRGNLKGVRLIDYDSLVGYIRNHVEPRYEELQPRSSGSISLRSQPTRACKSEDALPGRASKWTAAGDMPKSENVQ